MITFIDDRKRIIQHILSKPGIFTASEISEECDRGSGCIRKYLKELTSSEKIIGQNVGIVTYYINPSLLDSEKIKNTRPHIDCHYLNYKIATPICEAVCRYKDIGEARCAYFTFLKQKIK